MIRRSLIVALFAFSTLIVSAASTKPCDPLPCPDCGDGSYIQTAASTMPDDPLPCPDCGDGTLPV